MVEAERANLPELPDARRERFKREFALSHEDAELLTGSRALADYFETVAGECGDSRMAANWTMTTLMGALNRHRIELSESPVSARALAGLLSRILDNTISGKIAKEVFEAMWAGEGEADEIIEKRGLRQISDSSALEKMVDEVIAANPSQVEEYRGGKEKLLGFFVGQVMKLSRGQANPAEVSKIMKQKLTGQ